MNGRVIFFPLKHIPNEQTRLMLDKLQKEISHAILSIEIAEKNNKYQLTIRKQHLANTLRGKFRLLNGGKK